MQRELVRCYNISMAVVVCKHIPLVVLLVCVTMCVCVYLCAVTAQVLPKSTGSDRQVDQLFNTLSTVQLDQQRALRNLVSNAEIERYKQRAINGDYDRVSQAPSRAPLPCS